MPKKAHTNNKITKKINNSKKSNIATKDGNNNPKRRPRKQAEKIAPPVPMYFKSPYVCFSLEKQNEVLAEMGGVDANVNEVAKKISHAWQMLSQEELKVWVDASSKDNERYLSEKSKYDSFATTGKFPSSLKKKKKLPDRPKRPMSAYLFYAQKMRAIAKNDNSKMNNMEVTKLVGDMWNNACEMERKPYFELETAARAKFKASMKEWNVHNPKESEKPFQPQVRGNAEQGIKILPKMIVPTVTKGDPVESKPLKKQRKTDFQIGNMVMKDRECEMVEGGVEIFDVEKSAKNMMVKRSASEMMQQVIKDKFHSNTESSGTLKEEDDVIFVDETKGSLSDRYAVLQEIVTRKSSAAGNNLHQFSAESNFRRNTPEMNHLSKNEMNIKSKSEMDSVLKKLATRLSSSESIQTTMGALESKRSVVLPTKMSTSMKDTYCQNLAAERQHAIDEEINRGLAGRLIKDKLQSNINASDPRGTQKEDDGDVMFVDKTQASLSNRYASMQEIAQRSAAAAAEKQLHRIIAENQLRMSGPEGSQLTKNEMNNKGKTDMNAVLNKVAAMQGSPENMQARMDAAETKICAVLPSKLTSVGNDDYSHSLIDQRQHALDEEINRNLAGRDALSRYTLEMRAIEKIRMERNAIERQQQARDMQRHTDRGDMMGNIALENALENKAIELETIQRLNQRICEHNAGLDEYLIQSNIRNILPMNEGSASIRRHNQELLLMNPPILPSMFVYPGLASRFGQGSLGMQPLMSRHPLNSMQGGLQLGSMSYPGVSSAENPMIMYPRNNQG